MISITIIIIINQNINQILSLLIQIIVIKIGLLLLYYVVNLYNKVILVNY